MRKSPSIRRRRVPAFTLLASVALAGVLLVADVAGAQSVFITPNDPRPSYGWTITPVFVFSQATDSNVTLAGRDAVNTGDKVASISPSAEVSYLSPTTSASGGYAGSAVRYFTLGQLDTFDQRLYANFKEMVTRRVTLSAQASAGWLPTTDTVLLAGVPFMRVGSQIKTIEGGPAIALARHTTLSATYRLEYVDFDRSNPLTSQLLGGHTNGVSGSLRQQLSPQLTIGGAWDIRRAIIAGGLQQFNMLNGEGTVEYRFSPELFISGGFGVARIAGSLPGINSRVGPSWRAGIDYRIERRAFAFSTYSRSYVPSYGIGGTIQNEELNSGVRVPVAFRDRLVLGGSFAWRRNDPLALTGRNLTSLWFTATGSYAVAPWLRFEGFYSRSTQDSHLAGGVVQRQQIGVQVVTLAPMRFK